MRPEHIKAVYFIGAGGIGMSAIARYFMKKELLVTPRQLISASSVRPLCSCFCVQILCSKSWLRKK